MLFKIHVWISKLFRESARLTLNAQTTRLVSTILVLTRVLVELAELERWVSKMLWPKTVFTNQFHCYRFAMLSAIWPFVLAHRELPEMLPFPVVNLEASQLLDTIGTRRRLWAAATRKRKLSAVKWRLRKKRRSKFYKVAYLFFKLILFKPFHPAMFKNASQCSLDP